jgi:peptidoglycan/xylan/chitin deacetylase (PgdA/CDA1 family)
MRLPILTYHAVDDDGGPLAITAAAFRRQLGSMRRSGTEGLRLDRARARAEDAKNTVALTFDDGLTSVGDTAVPILEEFGFSATVFVVAGRIGMTNAWPGENATPKTRRLMDAGALRDLHSQGVEIGAHGFSHRRLTGLDSRSLRSEVVDSKTRLEDLIGAPVRSFAYPYGAAPESVRQLVRENYAFACTTEVAVWRNHHDTTRLPRIDAYYLVLPWFASLLVNSTADPFLGLIRVLRRIRRRGRSHD